ncbi:hypothetical protein PG989_013292 [Apiospora arundinis]
MDNRNILTKYKERPKNRQGFATAMDWWTSRHGTKANTKSDNPNEEAAFRALDKLVLHFRIYSALRPVSIFHRATWASAYPSWSDLNENKIAALKVRKEKFERAMDEVAPNRHGYVIW